MPPSDSALTDAWVQVRVPARDAQSTQVEICFNPEYVRAVWTKIPGQDTLRPTRSASYFPQSETLLLSDDLELKDVTVHVDAWLVPSIVESDVYHLRVEMVAPKVIRRGVSVTLHWNNTKYVAQLRSGDVFFEHITTPDFSQRFDNLPERNFRLSFEYVVGGKN